MNIKTRVLTAFLAIALLAGSLTACADNSDTPAGDTTTETNTETTADTAVRDDLPADLNYGGDQIVIISRERSGWTDGEIAVEKPTGEPVNDAVFERNKSVEERLGVNIKNVPDNDADYRVVVNKVALSVQSGQHDYDVLAGPCNATINEALNNTFHDLRKTKYINFEKPYWSQGFNDVVEYRGTQYLATGSAVLALYRFAFVTVFNKNLFTDAGQTFLYDEVRNGTWTLDRQNELVTVFHKDNGNGLQDLTGDTYGFVTNSHISVDPYWSSCRVDIIQKDENGYYEVAFNSAKLHSVTDKLMKLFYGNGHAVYTFPNEGNDDEQAKIRELFAAGDAAMATLRLLELEAGSVRNMANEFGVVPMPKYDTAREDYRTLLHNQFTVFAIPTTAPMERIDEIGAFLEAMSSEGYRTVKPAYYESTLRTKLIDDPESAEMLDEVVDNIYIDAGLLYTTTFDSFHDKFRVIMKSKTNTVSSDYRAKLTSLTKTHLPDLLRKLDQLVEADS